MLANWNYARVDDAFTMLKVFEVNKHFRIVFFFFQTVTLLATGLLCLSRYVGVQFAGRIYFPFW